MIIGLPRLGLVVPIAAFLAAVVAESPAGAQTTGAPEAPDSAGASARVQAQRLLQAGNDLFRADRYADALGAYREAHRLFPSPKLLFNIGRCEESLGHRAQAMLDLYTFVKQAVDADPLVRAEAERRMSELAATLAAVDVSGLPPNAKIAVDADAVGGLTPLDRPLWMEPGPHRISVDRPGRPLWVTTLDGKAGALTALTIADAEIRPAPDGRQPGGPGPAPAGEPTSEVSFLRRTWWIWAAIGVVVAAGATTLIVLKLRECPASLGCS